AGRHTAQVHALVYSPDGAALASTAEDGVTLVHVAATGATRARLVDGSRPLAACTWLDDAHLATGGADGVVRIWQADAGRIVRRLAHGLDIYGLALAPDRSWLAAFGHGAEVSVWPLATPSAAPLRLGGHQLGTDLAMAFGPWLVTTDEVGHIYV